MSKPSSGVHVVVVVIVVVIVIFVVIICVVGLEGIVIISLVLCSSEPYVASLVKACVRNRYVVIMNTLISLSRYPLAILRGGTSPRCFR